MHGWQRFNKDQLISRQATCYTLHHVPAVEGEARPNIGPIESMSIGAYGAASEPGFDLAISCGIRS